MILENGVLELGEIISQTEKSTIYRSTYKGGPVTVKVVECGRNLMRVHQVLNSHNYAQYLHFIVLPYKKNISTSLEVHRSLDLGGDQAAFVFTYLQGVDYNTLSSEEIIRYFPSMRSQLQTLHSWDIYHCDVKPQNIIFKPDYTVVYIDFGSAVLCNGIYNAQLSTTPNYGAPEAVHRRRWSVTQLRKVDTYGLGITLLSMHSKKKISDVCKCHTVETLRDHIDTNLATSISQMHAIAISNAKSNITGHLRTIKDMCSYNPPNRPDVLKANCAII
jgi:serine/threonine protein kinase